MIGMYEVAKLMDHNVLYTLSGLHKQFAVQSYYALVYQARTPAAFHGSYPELGFLHSVRYEGRIDFIQDFVKNSRVF